MRPVLQTTPLFEELVFSTIRTLNLSRDVSVLKQQETESVFLSLSLAIARKLKIESQMETKIFKLGKKSQLDSEELKVLSKLFFEKEIPIL